MKLPLNIDWQQILLHAFNFILLGGGLGFLLYKPVKKFMNGREEYYKNMDAEAEKKLADAKENPEEYPSVTKNPENAENQEGGALHQNAALEDDVVEADEPEITRVDTSHMGKIGKMAHFIGSQAADEEETDE